MNTESSSGASPSVSGSIVVREINKTFVGKRGLKTAALVDINLAVTPGEFVSILGPSGCGKTTLLRVLAGLTAASGSVMLDDVLVDKPQKKIGVVFQEPTLLPWLTVLENVMLPARLRRRPAGLACARAHDLLSLVGLEDFARSYPAENHQITEALLDTLAYAA